MDSGDWLYDGTLEENNAEGRAPGLTYEGRRYELIMEYWRTVDDPSESDSEASPAESSSAQSRAIDSSAMGVEAVRFSICDAISDIAPVGGSVVLDGGIVRGGRVAGPLALATRERRSR